jgi:hypothetical protein
MVGSRFSAVTASARMVPALICAAAGGIDENATGVCPATTDWIIGPPPVNGIAVRLSFSDSLNSSPDRFAGVPTPGCA